MWVWGALDVVLRAARPHRSLATLGMTKRMLAAILMTGHFVAHTVARGGQVYRALNCGSCHEPNLFGQRLGPPLDHVGSVAATRRTGMSAEAYLRESILTSQAKIVKGFQPLMPTFQGLISEENLVALIEHVKSLSPKATTAAAPLPAGGTAAPAAASKAPARKVASIACKAKK